ncbi:hypothetical protein Tco_1013996 [Tanacetum coccineum]|uniref:Uncharacterized protein n=1 Tax=Tanacetum coccineum TaxID=301880 RepID=A0ABQ5J0J8_9ASTR
MANFPRLQELTAARNSNNLNDAIENAVIRADLFGGPLAVQCAEYLKQLSKTKVLRMLELRKTIAEVHIQLHKKIDFLTVLKFY